MPPVWSMNSAQIVDSAAYQKGHKANLAGHPVTANIYGLTDKPRHCLWRIGWNDAQIEQGPKEHAG